MIQIYALCCGYLEFDRHIFFPDRAPGTRMTIPVPSYLLIHPKGRVLFDTDVHCQAIVDPVGRLGERRATRFTIRSQVGNNVVSQLVCVGMRPADITHVINSHSHFDHCGGNEFFPQATQLVFTGDACYTQEHLDRDVLPQAVWNAEAMSYSLTTLRNLRDSHGAALFYGHDPRQWQVIRHAPGELL
jgi:glyoxylase-like metal-dependent hydrolase (beta-lactamase superfamily II)